MRSKRLAAAAVAAAALGVVPVAAAGMMHPELGAHLSGMGETRDRQPHGAREEAPALLEVPADTMHVLGATVRDKSGMTVANLGHMYRAKGCAMVPKMSLQLIEEKPGHYWVWVATKGHPGELRGKLFAGMAHM